MANHRHGVGRAGRGFRLLGAVASVCLAVGCTIGGSAVMAPYRSRPLDQVRLTAVRSAGAPVLALAPNGSTIAVADRAHGVCIRPLASAAGQVCTHLSMASNQPTAAAFSADGRILAFGQNVVAQGRGRVWLVDVRTGAASAVPGVESPPAGSPSAGRPGGSAARAASTSSGYTAMLWNSTSGHLLLVGNSFDDFGAFSQIVDVDPESGIPRVVARATGPYEFESGYLATGGPTVILTVYHRDQFPPNLVIVDLRTGVRREFGPLGSNGTQLIPLAVSPDGGQAIVGSATLGNSGPPRLLDLTSGNLTDIRGLSGNFAVAGYSPNGTQIAVVTQMGGSLRAWAAPRSGGAARELSTGSSTIASASRLAWSTLDAWSLSNSSPSVADTIVGWILGS